MNIRKLGLAALLIFGLVQLNSQDGKVGPSLTSKRWIIVHEPLKQSPQFSTATRSLMLGEAHDWIVKQGITLQVLPVNAIEADGRPAQIVDRWKPYKPPELLQLSNDGERLIKRQPCPDDAAKILQVLGK